MVDALEEEVSEPLLRLHFQEVVAMEEAMEEAIEVEELDFHSSCQYLDLEEAAYLVF